MGKIFCLETEWIKSIHDMKSKSSALNLLEFLEDDPNTRIPFVYRKVATYSDFEYYLKHLERDSYNAYDTVYLCFHGSECAIGFADKSSVSILDIADKNPAIFKGKNVHLGCCSTLNIDEDIIRDFKRVSGARMVTGYKSDVDSIDAFIFELWLLTTMNRYPEYAGKRIFTLATERMGYYCDQLGFVAI